MTAQGITFPISIRAASARLGISRHQAAALIVIHDLPTFADGRQPNAKLLDRAAYGRLEKAARPLVAAKRRAALASA